MEERKETNKTILETEAKAQAGMEVYQDAGQVTSTGFLVNQETPHTHEIKKSRTRISPSGQEDLQNLKRRHQLSGLSASASKVFSL